MSERFGYDHGERLIFDRTKPCKDCDRDETCGLFEEVTTEELIEIANDLASRLDAVRSLLNQWQEANEKGLGFAREEGINALLRAIGSAPAPSATSEGNAR